MADEPLEVMIQRYAAALRAYLTVHPNAGDTLTGVACYWVQPRPQGRHEIVALELALEQMVAESRMFKRACLDGRVIYGGVGPELKH